MAGVFGLGKAQSAVGTKMTFFRIHRCVHAVIMKALRWIRVGISSTQAREGGSSTMFFDFLRDGTVSLLEIDFHSRSCLDIASSLFFSRHHMPPRQHPSTH